MTKTCIIAHTSLAPVYPGYINVSREDDGSVIITARGDPDVRPDGSYICGYARDRGQPGRCTPGDDRCNNYCNSAPEKGPMQPSPSPCVQTYPGATVSVKLSAAEWDVVAAAIAGESK